MQKIILALGLATLLASTYFLNNQEQVTLDEDYTAFNMWKTQQSKRYGAAEEAYRYAIFKDNANFIAEHNKLYDQGLSTFRLGLNQFSDISNEEFNARLLTRKPRQIPENVEYFTGEDQVTADSVDWRALGAVNSVRNQGNCGSCWTFAAVSSSESRIFQTTGVLPQLAEQELVDCANYGPYPNEGCNGGWEDTGIQYIADNGITTAASYPYTAKDGVCKKNLQPRYSVGSVRYPTPKSEASLLAAIATVPTTVALNGGNRFFQAYASGIFSQQCAPVLNHAVTAVGYGVSGTTPFYIVRNSWGTSWGEQGYIRIKRTGDGDGICGVQDDAAFAY